MLPCTRPLSSVEGSRGGEGGEVGEGGTEDIVRDVKWEAKATAEAIRTWDPT